MDQTTSHPCRGVYTVIVPAAGMGTRFLPATKTVPKELLPVVDTPGIELIAAEAAELGAQKLAIITAPNKQEVLEHFKSFPELEATLKARGKNEQLAKVRRAHELIRITPVEQAQPLGLGHAVGLAEEVLDAEEDVVAVMLPDDLVMPSDVVHRMLDVREQLGGSVLCAFEVEPSEVSNYGVFEIAEAEYAGEHNVRRVTGMVEKPAQEDAPSHFVATGRYLLDRAIFDALQRITPGAGGELQLTDAIELLIQEGHPVHILIHEGKRHDLGNPGGYIQAVVDFGLSNPEYGPHLGKVLRRILDEHGV
ncbi:MAG: UTP--glucose-1-phosphate uridylyltransferase [Corynebacterium sp.]|nr:UTP--glucose-1-phosphate uridylyltransferase [Corynebacterium sp.]